MLNGQVKIPESQYRVINEQVSAVTVTVDEPGFDTLMCCHQWGERFKCIIAYAKIYTEGKLWIMEDISKQKFSKMLLFLKSKKCKIGSFFQGCLMQILPARARIQRWTPWAVSGIRALGHKSDYFTGINTIIVHPFLFQPDCLLHRW